MALRNPKKLNQTNDLRANIHHSFEVGSSKEGALLAAADRYPKLSKSTIRSLIEQIYGERNILDEITSKPGGQFTSLKSLFGCKGSKVLLTAYIEVELPDTGEVREFGFDLLVEPDKKTFNLSGFWKDVLAEMKTAIQNKKYKFPKLPKGVTAYNLARKGVLSFKGFKCID